MFSEASSKVVTLSYINDEMRQHIFVFIHFASPFNLFVCACVYNATS